MVPSLGRVLPGLETTGRGKPLTRARIERISSRVVAAVSLVFAIQSIPAMVQSVPEMRQPWSSIVVIIFFIALDWVVVASIVQRNVALSAATFAIIYLCAIATWPLLVDSARSIPDVPWLWWLCSVATALAVLAFSVTLAAIYTVITPICYGILHASAAGGGADITSATRDVIYAIILGGVVLIIVTMMRQAASNVDAAQTAALERYAAIARDHAHEAERAEVDALVHDSVLTTLLSAAAAQIPEAQSLAARLAAESLKHLDNAADRAPTGSQTIPLARLSDRLAAAARAFAAPFDVDAQDIANTSIPADVADALHLAVQQAMVNSAQHAGSDEVERHLDITGLAPAGIEIVVTDDGVGFDPEHVPYGRIGLRISVAERIARIGGTVEVRSSPGEGTAVLIQWRSDTATALAVDDSEEELPSW